MSETYETERGVWRDWLSQQRPVNSHSLALEASRVAYSGECRLFGISVLNTNAASQFIQLFDANAVPSDNAVPVCVFTVSGSSNLGLYWGPPGRWFNRGVVICNSSTAATKTIGSADCYFDVQVL